MINFNSNYNSVKNAACEGAATVNNTETGREMQAFSIGQKVHYTNDSPVRFYNGVITDVYSENGYYYYIVEYDGNVRTFRQKDIELSPLQNNMATKRAKTAANGYVYQYETNAENDVITINGRSYKVCDTFGWAIKIQKTQIHAYGGAVELVKTLTEWPSDCWERKILNNCKPLKR